MGKLDAVDFSFDFQRRYTFWSGLLGGFFLALSYFGTDQSQVQRYLAGGSLAAGRFGLLFNAVLKLPMQFFILLTGVMVFIFFQFEKPPLFFNQPALPTGDAKRAGWQSWPRCRPATTQVFAEKQDRHSRPNERLDSRSTPAIESRGRGVVRQRTSKVDALRGEVKQTLKVADPRSETGDADYVFITFVLNYLPHGVIGLLIAVIFCAGDVLQRRGNQRAWFDHGGGFLPAASPSERERLRITCLPRNCSLPSGVEWPFPLRSSPIWSRT